jgi:hypothetical protein
MVSHKTGPHWLETGTELFCPECDGRTVIMLQAAQQGAAPDAEAGELTNLEITNINTRR